MEPVEVYRQILGDAHDTTQSAVLHLVQTCIMLWDYDKASVFGHIKSSVTDEVKGFELECNLHSMWRLAMLYGRAHRIADLESALLAMDSVVRTIHHPQHPQSLELVK